MSPVALVFLMGMGLCGVVLWRTLARGGLHPLRDDETTRHGVSIFVAMMLLSSVAAVAVRSGEGGEEGLNNASLHDIVAVQALTYGLTIGLVLAVVKRCGISLGKLGLWPTEGAPAPGLAIAAWLACYPFFVAASMLNEAIFPQGTEVLQDNILRFMGEEGAATDPIVWLCIVVVIPIAEEIMFRGALFGGLRRALPPWAAMLLTGMIFGAMHDGATMLPVATLGILLAWLYERTGSLAAPCFAHCLHNGFTLALTILIPEGTV